MKTMFEMVKDFHKAFGLEINHTPTVPNTEVVKLRWELIEEEIAEARDELIEFYFNGAPPNEEKTKLALARMSKEIADSIYVLLGAAITFGLDMDKVFAEVHKSNMSKLGDNGKPIYREDGKVLKSTYYQEPNVVGVLYDD